MRGPQLPVKKLGTKEIYPGKIDLLILGNGVEVLVIPATGNLFTHNMIMLCGSGVVGDGHLLRGM